MEVRRSWSTETNKLILVSARRGAKPWDRCVLSFAAWAGDPSDSRSISVCYLAAISPHTTAAQPEESTKEKLKRAQNAASPNENPRHTHEGPGPPHEPAKRDTELSVPRCQGPHAHAPARPRGSRTQPLATASFGKAPRKTHSHVAGALPYCRLRSSSYASRNDNWTLLC